MAFECLLARLDVSEQEPSATSADSEDAFVERQSRAVKARSTRTDGVSPRLSIEPESVDAVIEAMLLMLSAGKIGETEALLPLLRQSKRNSLRLVVPHDLGE